MKQTFALTAILILVLLVSGCEEVTGGFEEYVGVNLLEYSDGTLLHDFASGDWQPSILDANYLSFDNAVGLVGDTTLLPWDTDISRLEVPNLAANGDFENALTHWTVDPVNDLTRFDAADPTHGANAIDDWSIFFDSRPDKSQLINFNLQTGLSDTFLNTGIYGFHFDFRGQYLNQFDINDGSAEGSYFQSPWQYDSLDDLSFPLWTFPDVVIGDGHVVDQGAATPFFSLGTQIIGTQRAQVGYLDNFRVIRIDVDKWIYLEVPLQEPGRSDLVSGTYEFSLYVRNEEAASISPTVPNAFPAGGVSLRIEDLTPYPQGKGWTYSSATAVWNEWTRISIRGNIDIEASVAPADSVLRLAVSPADIGNQIPGRILIATPALQLIP